MTNPNHDLSRAPEESVGGRFDPFPLVRPILPSPALQDSPPTSELMDVESADAVQILESAAALIHGGAQAEGLALAVEGVRWAWQPCMPRLLVDLEQADVLMPRALSSSNGLVDAITRTLKAHEDKRICTPASASLLEGAILALYGAPRCEAIEDALQLAHAAGCRFLDRPPTLPYPRDLCDIVTWTTARLRLSRLVPTDETPRSSIHALWGVLLATVQAPTMIAAGLHIIVDLSEDPLLTSTGPDLPTPRSLAIDTSATEAMVAGLSEHLDAEDRDQVRSIARALVVDDPGLAGFLSDWVLDPGLDHTLS